jgi:predicted transcriptional regulator YdeE
MITSALQTILAINAMISPTLRTSNTLEFNAGTAKIGPTYGAFMQKYGPTITGNSKLIATYSNYESDHNGDYDWALGFADNVSRDGLSAHTLPAGKYIVFSGQGSVPEITVQVWMHIWQYFEKNTEHKRAYTIDFALYDMSKPGSVEIYIAVQ